MARPNPMVANIDLLVCGAWSLGQLAFVLTGFTGWVRVSFALVGLAFVPGYLLLGVMGTSRDGVRVWRLYDCWGWHHMDGARGVAMALGLSLAIASLTGFALALSSVPFGSTSMTLAVLTGSWLAIAVIWTKRRRSVEGAMRAPTDERSEPLESKLEKRLSHLAAGITAILLAVIVAYGLFASPAQDPALAVFLLDPEGNVPMGPVDILAGQTVELVIGASIAGTPDATVAFGVSFEQEGERNASLNGAPQAPAPTADPASFELTVRSAANVSRPVTLTFPGPGTWRVTFSSEASDPELATSDLTLLVVVQSQ